MNTQEYQNFTKLLNRCIPQVQREHLTAGLAAETGEVCALIQKFCRDTLSSKELNSNMFEKKTRKLKRCMRDELGDVMWYVTEMASHFDLTLDEVLEHNIKKLKKRYGVK